MATLDEKTTIKLGVGAFYALMLALLSVVGTGAYWLVQGTLRVKEVLVTVSSTAAKVDEIGAAQQAAKTQGDGVAAKLDTMTAQTKLRIQNWGWWRDLANEDFETLAKASGVKVGAPKVPKPPEP